jgi:MarR family transcriptional regulator, temperature-dependent positive regulator of motility
MILISGNETVKTPAAADLDPLSGSLAHALRRAQQAVFHDFAAVLEAGDIRPGGYAMLAILRSNPGIRQTRAAAVLDIRTPNFVPLFDALERRGLVERRAVGSDRRGSGLFLSDAGAELLARLDAAVAAHEARFTRRIGPEGKAQLLGLLARLADPAFG